MSLFDFLNPLSVITGPIEKITQAITQVQIEKAKALTDEKKIEADERLKTLEAKRDVLIGESASGIKLNALIRSLMAIPVCIVLWKLFVFDYAFGQWLEWSTPAMSSDMNLVMMTIIGFYFVDSIASRFKR